MNCAGLVLYEGFTATEWHHKNPKCRVWEKASQSPELLRKDEGGTLHTFPWGPWELTKPRHQSSTVAPPVLCARRPRAGVLHLQKRWLGRGQEGMVYLPSVCINTSWRGTDWARLTWSPCLDSTVPAVTWCSVTLPFSNAGFWRRKGWEVQFTALCTGKGPRMWGSIQTKQVRITVKTMLQVLESL